MKAILYIFIGGGIGSVLRYLCARWVDTRLTGLFSQAVCKAETAVLFPWGTLAVNITGCALIGFLYGMNRTNALSPELLLLFTAGFCGGFTTFSAFSNEMLLMLRSGNYLAFMTYSIGSLAVGLLATAAGYRMSTALC